MDELQNELSASKSISSQVKEALQARDKANDSNRGE